MQSGGRYLAVAPLSSPASAPPLSSPTGASEASDESSRAATPNVDPAAAAVGAAPAATTQTKGAATHARTASSATKHVIQIPPSRAHLLAQQQAAAAAAALAGQSSLAAPVRSSQRRNKLHGSTRRFDQDYVLLPEYLLGSGASGTVYVCTSRRHPTHEYAVKVIKTDQVQLDTDKMREEMQILATIRHRNIIRLKDVYQTDDTIHIVTELAFGGELFDRILKVRSFSESDVVNLTRKLFGAVAYLHGRGIIHRDLKPENLLFSTNDKDSDIKISGQRARGSQAAEGLALIIHPSKALPYAVLLSSYSSLLFPSLFSQTLASLATSSSHPASSAHAHKWAAFVPISSCSLLMA